MRSRLLLHLPTETCDCSDSTLCVTRQAFLILGAKAWCKALTIIAITSSIHVPHDLSARALNLSTSHIYTNPRRKTRNVGPRILPRRSTPVPAAKVRLHTSPTTYFATVLTRNSYGPPQGQYAQGPPMQYGAPPPQQQMYYGPPQGQQYQQAPPPKQKKDRGCLTACLATLCCCFVCEEGCECCADCCECAEDCC
jgi:hypothetical protein